MKFRKKVSFSIIVLKILLVSLVRSFPQTFTSNSYNKNEKCSKSPFISQSFQHEINGDIWNVFQEPGYEMVNFPEVECSLSSKAKPIGDKNKDSFNCKSRSIYLPKRDYFKKLKNTSSKNELSLPPEFSSAPNYRDIANFPEVEYPLSAKEMWKPNYWNSQPTDYPYNNVHVDQYCINPTFNDYFTEVQPKRNFGTNLKPGTQAPFLTKSLSDPTKNLISLKNKDSINNVLTNENKKENTTISLDSSKVSDLHIIVTPNLCTPYLNENKLSSDFIHDICPKDTKQLDKLTEIPNFNVLANLTSQSEILVNAYAEKFKDEIKSVLKSVTNDIILNNCKFNKDKETPPVLVTGHTTDILETSTKSDSLNIYDEFTSPDLLKNRRSQDFDEYTKYNKDFFIPYVDLESKLRSNDLLIDSYADKFHKDMATILKSNAENYLLSTSENTKNHIFETNIKHSGIKDYNKSEPLKTHYDKHLKQDFSKINYEPILPVTDMIIDAKADKFHNEMTHKVKSKAENILLNKFEKSNHKPIGPQKNTNNNNKHNDKSKLPSNADSVNIKADKTDNKMSNILKPAADNVMRDFGHSKNVIKDDSERLNNKKNLVKSDKSLEKKITSTTQPPKLPDIPTNTNNNNFKANVKQELRKVSDNKLNNKTATSFDSLTSTAGFRNDMTCNNKALASCKSDENIINNTDKEEGIFLPAHNIEENNIPYSDPMNKDIELEEDFTTDSYPENDGGDWSSYALSTVAPRTSTIDLLWRDSSVIEPDKSLSYPDELEQYFLMS